MARKKRAEAPTGDPGAWMVTFTDMLQLLLTFFIMLLSLASIDDKALKQTFSMFMGAVGPLYLGQKTIILPTETGPIDVPKAIELQAFSSLLSMDPQQTTAEYSETLSYAHGLFGKGVRVEKRGKDLAIVFPETISFAPDSADILPDLAEVLRRIGRVMKYSDNQIHIEGHTDSAPVNPESGFSSGWDLSAARAVNVMRFLNEETEVPFDRMFCYGYSRYHPVAANLTEYGRARNRRIEIIIRQFLTEEASSEK